MTDPLAVEPVALNTNHGLVAPQWSYHNGDITVQGLLPSYGRQQTTPPPPGPRADFFKGMASRTHLVLCLESYPYGVLFF